MTEKQAIEQLQNHVMVHYDGSYRKCFLSYDVDSDGKIGAAELECLLSDSSVGNRLTRGAWAKGIIDRLDTDDDGKISFDEFEAAIQNNRGE